MIGLTEGIRPGRGTLRELIQEYVGFDLKRARAIDNSLIFVLFGQIDFHFS